MAYITKTFLENFLFLSDIYRSRLKIKKSIFFLSLKILDNLDCVSYKKDLSLLATQVLKRKKYSVYGRCIPKVMPPDIKCIGLTNKRYIRFTSDDTIKTAPSVR